MQATNMQTNELILKEQRPVQSQYGILEVFMINFILIIFCCLETVLTNRFCRKSTGKKKIQIKVWYIRYRNIEF